MGGGGDRVAGGRQAANADERGAAAGEAVTEHAASEADAAPDSSAFALAFASRFDFAFEAFLSALAALIADFREGVLTLPSCPSAGEILGIGRPLAA